MATVLLKWECFTSFLQILIYKEGKMSNRQIKSDVILIGAGIMSATLGTLLKELAPDWKITVFEKLEKQAKKVLTN